MVFQNQYPKYLRVSSILSVYLSVHRPVLFIPCSFRSHYNLDNSWTHCTLTIFQAFASAFSFSYAVKTYMPKSSPSLMCKSNAAFMKKKKKKNSLIARGLVWDTLGFNLCFLSELRNSLHHFFVFICFCFVFILPSWKRKHKSTYLYTLVAKINQDNAWHMVST